jgi:hypothetical protein
MDGKVKKLDYERRDNRSSTYSVNTSDQSDSETDKKTGGVETEVTKIIPFRVRDQLFVTYSRRFWLTGTIIEP